MARRSGTPEGVGYGDKTAVLDPPQDDDLAPARRRSTWPGAGGRWWLWIGRAVLWAFIVVVVVNGIRAPFERFTSSSPSNSGTAAPGKQDTSGYPTATASAYALEFAQIYLDFDHANADDRAAKLQFFTQGTTSDPQFGWDGGGALAVTAIEVADVDASSANQANVTLLVQSGSTWFQLSVPVYAKDGALAVNGEPALLPAPPHATPPAVAAPAGDTALVSQLTQPLQGFFAAYGAGDKASLSRYVLPGGDVPASGFDGTLTFVQLNKVTAPTGPADQRVVTASVTWQIASGRLTQSYDVSVVQRSGQWYVKDVTGATP